jgi:hypothetical protein
LLKIVAVTPKQRQEIELWLRSQHFEPAAQVLMNFSHTTSGIGFPEA